MFFLASSKLLPRTVTDRPLQSPFQPSSSGQKSQSIGMLAVTWRFTTGEVIITALESWLCKLINVEKHSGELDVYRSGGNLLAESQPDLCRITRVQFPRDRRQQLLPAIKVEELLLRTQPRQLYGLRSCRSCPDRISLPS
jgi:hypothetical protein